MTLLDPNTYKHATLLILAIIGLLTALKKLSGFISTCIPKSLLQELRPALHALAQWFVREMSLPKRYPLVETAVEVMFTAIYYILTFYCFLLFLIDVGLTFFSDPVIWRCAAGIAIAIAISLMTRWCFKQAEVSRIKLSSTSRNLW